MKTLLALLLVLGFSFSAFAGNEGPQAMPTPSATHKLIAEYVVSAFFVPPTVPSLRKYQIYDNGYTQLVSQTRSPNKKTVKRLEALSAKDAERFKALVEEIVPGKLFELDPKAPRCEDAPVVTLMVYSSKGEIVIDQNANCKESGRVNRSHADEVVISTLTELASQR
jgi:hypothetical protein